MEQNYIFHNTCYDKELLRKQTIVLNESGIDFKIVPKQNKTHARAPLGSYFESEMYISENDFEKADNILKELINDFS